MLSTKGHFDEGFLGFELQFDFYVNGSVPSAVSHLLFSHTEKVLQTC